MRENIHIFVHLGMLTTLTLFRNERVTTYPAGIFDNLGMLTSLDLADNTSITTYPDGVFTNLIGLTSLSLGFGGLTSCNSMDLLRWGVLSTLTSVCG